MDNPVNWLIAVGICTGISISALCLYLVWLVKTDVRRFIGETTHTMDFLRDEVKDLKQRTLPILQNVEETSRNSTSITRRIDSQLEKTERVVDEVQNLSKKVVEMEHFLQTRIFEPLAQVAGVIAGTRKAVHVFTQAMRHREPRQEDSLPENGRHRD